MPVWRGRRGPGRGCRRYGWRRVPCSFPICPAVTRARGVAGPLSKMLIAVTRPAWSRPNRTWSRVRMVPENIRAYAIFSPAGPRSTLKTVPETGPPGSPPAVGSRSRRPAASASTPAPVMAEPENTGCTRPARAWAASPARSRL